MCLVNDNETFRANKHFVSLELAARAQAGLTIRGGEVVEGAGLVRVEAGAWLDLLCHGYEGVPAPSFTWRGPARASGSSLLIQQVSHELTRSWSPRSPEVTPPLQQSGAVRSNTSHAYSGSSVARYRAELGDTNQSLSCTVTQEAEDGRWVGQGEGEG